MDPRSSQSAPPHAPPLRWGVVGGGMLGLGLALELRRRGHAVTVFEAAPQFGGLASAWQLGDVTWDRHYHVTLLSDLRLRALLAELGLEPEWRTTRTGMYSGGRLHSISNAVEFLAYPGLGPLQKVRLAATLRRASRTTDWAALEDDTSADWLRRHSGLGAYARFWEPLLRSKLGDNAGRVSAVFIAATIARLEAARRSGLKRELFGYVPGGYARVLDRLTSVLAERGVRLEASAAVRAVRGCPCGVTVEREGIPAETFDRVVVTAPAPAAAQLCPGLPADFAAALSQVEYQGIVCASLLLPRKLSDFYVTNLADPGLPFTGVIEMSALVDPVHFGGRALVYLPRYVPPDDPLFEASDDAIRDLFLAGLERMHPGFRRADVQAFRVSRVRRAFALPTPGYSRRLPPIATPTPGLFAVSSAHITDGTLNVNETLRLADRALEVMA